MNRNIASTLALAATTAIAATMVLTVARNARADDITIEPTPFVSSRTRAEVRNDLSMPGRNGTTEWSLQHPAPQQASVQQGATEESSQPGASRAMPLQARADVRAQIIAARRQITEMNSEDSGSSYLWKLRPRHTQ